MSEVRVKSWPLAVIGSLLVHVSALTGVYLAPGAGSGVALGQPGMGHALDNDTTPLYLIPDELPPDVAARLAAEQEAAAKIKTRDEGAVPAPKPEMLVLAKPLPELEPVPVPLGVVDGPKIQTEAWLNFESPLEHGAILSKVEQPQQDLLAKPAPQGNPGVGGADGQTPAPMAAEQSPAPPKDVLTPSAAPGQPVAAAAAAPVDPRAPAKVAAPNEQSPIVEVKPTADIPEGPRQTEIKAGNSGGKTPEVVRGASEPKVLPVEATGPPTPPSLPRPAVDAATGVTQGGPTDPIKTAQENPRAPGAPGVPMASKTVASDRDSDAASVKRAAVFRNGKVEAGEGLDIRTVRPEISLTSRALQRPRNPTLEIVFGKDGRAKRVRVLKSSGFPADVDEPVVTALYNWRAKGRVLDQLPARPDATVSLEITIIFE